MGASHREETHSRARPWPHSLRCCKEVQGSKSTGLEENRTGMKAAEAEVKGHPGASLFPSRGLRTLPLTPTPTWPVSLQAVTESRAGSISLPKEAAFIYGRPGIPIR